MSQLAEAIEIADDSENPDEQTVSMSLGDFRGLLRTFRKLGAICAAMTNGAEQCAKSAADFSAWCKTMVPK